jgi:general secretion pathway protein L
MQLILAYDSEHEQYKRLPISAWCLLDDNGKVELSGAESSFADMAQTVKPYTFVVHVFLINPDVAVLTIPRPAGSFSKIRQALPYLLEEQLAEDVEDLHFAVLNQTDPQRLVVAITARSIMQQCTWGLTRVGLIPQTFLPLWLALPQPQANQWLALTDTDYIWLRSGKFSGMACERAHVLPLLSVLYTKQAPTEMHWVTPNNVDPEWLEECQTRNIASDVTEIKSPETWISYIAKNFSAEPGMNLLQGEFTVTEKTVSEKRWWQTAKILAVSVVAVWFVGILGQYFYLSWENNRLQQKIADTYREVFPDAQKISNPRGIFERELNNNSRDKGNNDFLGLLLRVGEVTAAYPQIQMGSITYDNQELVINITVDNFSRLQQIDKELQAQGLTVEQENATSTGGIVQARWRIG